MSSETRFKRHQFHGDYADTTPKWHIHAGDYPGKWGEYVALCGYVKRNLVGDLKVSRAKTRPKRALICARCLKEDAARGAEWDTAWSTANEKIKECAR